MDSAATAAPWMVLVFVLVLLFQCVDECTAFGVPLGSSHNNGRSSLQLAPAVGDGSALLAGADGGGGSSLVLAPSNRYYGEPTTIFSAPYSLWKSPPLLEQGEFVIETTAVECHDVVVVEEETKPNTQNLLNEERIDAFRGILAVLPQCVEGCLEMDAIKIALSTVNLLGSLSSFVPLVWWANKRSRSVLRSTAPLVVGSLEILYIALSLRLQSDPVQAFQESVWKRIDGTLAEFHNKLKPAAPPSSKKERLWKKLVAAPLQRLQLLQPVEPEQSTTSDLGMPGVIDVPFYRTLLPETNQLRAARPRLGGGGASSFSSPRLVPAWGV